MEVHAEDADNWITRIIADERWEDKRYIGLLIFFALIVKIYRSTRTIRALEHVPSNDPAANVPCLQDPWYVVGDRHWPTNGEENSNYGEEGHLAVHGHETHTHAHFETSMSPTDLFFRRYVACHARRNNVSVLRRRCT